MANGTHRFDKPSQILLEADQTAQTVGVYTDGWDQQIKSARSYCAVGMICCKIGQISQGVPILIFDEICLQEFDLKVEGKTCPIEGCIRLDTAHNLERNIVHLNDVHKWTFKLIGEWLQGLGY